MQEIKSKDPKTGIEVETLFYPEKELKSMFGMSRLHADFSGGLWGSNLLYNTLGRLHRLTLGVVNTALSFSGFSKSKKISIDYRPYMLGDGVVKFHNSKTLSGVRFNKRDIHPKEFDHEEEYNLMRSLYPKGEKPDIQIELLSNTSLSSQKSQIMAVLAHELSHFIFDSELQVFTSVEHSHHKEYIADYFSSVVSNSLEGTDHVLHSYERRYYYADIQDIDVESHPSLKKRRYALEHKLYEPIVNEQIQKLMECQLRGKSFSSWVNFLENQDRYVEIQNNINKETKSL